MPAIAPPHTVAVLAPDRVVGFDLAIPCQVFNAARAADLSRLYTVKVCGATGGGLGHRERRPRLRPHSAI
jgi:hypothetical protein